MLGGSDIIFNEILDIIGNYFKVVFVLFILRIVELHQVFNISPANNDPDH